MAHNLTCRMVVLAGMWLLYGIAGLQATVLLPADLPELVTAAQAIVVGRVSDVQSGWVEGRRRIETVITVEVVEHLKGRFGSVVNVRVPGGRMGRYRHVVVGAPRFEPGDDVVLFLRANGPSLPFIVGLSQGVFRVVANGSGEALVLPPPLAGAAASAIPVVRGEPARRPLTWRAFRDQIRSLSPTPN